MWAGYHEAAGSEMVVKGLKIRCPKGRAGSTPALGTIPFESVNRLVQKVFINIDQRESSFETSA